MFLSDGFKGIEGVIHKEFPAAKHQHCLVHLFRNLWSHVRVGHREALAEDFKAVYQSRSRESAQSQLETFIEKWGKNYPQFKKILKRPDLFTFYDFPETVQRSVYSTNLLESYNKALKRQAKKHIQFVNEAALERFLVTQLMNYNSKFESRAHKGLAQVCETLESMFI